MATAPDDTLRGLLEDFSVAMLVTRTGEGELRARPMGLAEVQPDGTLWFLTDRHSGKVEELALREPLAKGFSSSPGHASRRVGAP